MTMVAYGVVKKPLKRTVFSALIFCLLSGVYCAWKAPVLLRLPFRQTRLLTRLQNIDVCINGKVAKQVVVYGTGNRTGDWPESIVVDFQGRPENYSKIQIRPLTRQVGHGNDGPEFYTSILRAFLVESNAVGFISFNSAKSFEEDAHFELSHSRIAFRLPKGLKCNPGAIVELIQKPLL